MSSPPGWSPEQQDGVHPMGRGLCRSPDLHRNRRVLASAVVLGTALALILAGCGVTVQTGQRQQVRMQAGTTSTVGTPGTQAPSVVTAVHVLRSMSCGRARGRPTTFLRWSGP
jgi:hypothetical protein